MAAAHIDFPDKIITGIGLDHPLMINGVFVTDQVHDTGVFTMSQFE